jgi:hypothetical protein
MTTILQDFQSKEFHAIYIDPITVNKYYFPSSKSAIFKDKRIVDTLYFKDMHPYSFNPDIRFENCTFSHDVVFSKHDYDYAFTFYNCTFEGDVTFKAGNFGSTVRFLDGEIKGELKIDNSSFTNLLVGLNCKHVQIAKGNFAQMYLAGYNKNTEETNTIDKLYIDFDNVEGTLNIRYLFIKEIDFRGSISKDTQLLLTQLSFANLRIENLFNNGKIRISTLMPKPKLINQTLVWIANSNLSKTEFFDINLQKVKTIMISNSFLLECTFVNVLWPDKLNVLPKIVDIENFLDSKETYRQLKYAYSRQGDAVLEHKFHGLEMNAYMSYLWNNGEAFKWKGIWTFLVLKLSGCTSDYGQSVAKPLWTLFTCVLLLFPLQVRVGGVDSLQFHFDFSCQQVINTIGEALAFVNPLRKFESIHQGLPVIIDIVMRIISSYCLYNVLRATRRFVK